LIKSRIHTIKEHKNFKELLKKIYNTYNKAQKNCFKLFEKFD